jgi:hypothetical protein
VDAGAGEEVVIAGRGNAVFVGDGVDVEDEEQDDLDDAAADDDLVSQSAGPITCDIKMVELRVQVSACGVAA